MSSVADSVDARRSKGAADPVFEAVHCYYCGSAKSTEFVIAQDDLSGRPGDFRFVTCDECGLRYQSPRVRVERIGEYYDNEYIAHRKKVDWGLLTPLHEFSMTKHDRDKDALVRKYVKLTPKSQVLDVGCAVGTFLDRMHKRYGARVAGVDFKDLSGYPTLANVEFHHGFFYDQAFEAGRFDLVTMWHFLEHEYDPMRSLAKAKEVLKPGSGRLVIEVPRLDSLSFPVFRERWPGLQAPQHTILFDKDMLLKFVKKQGLEVVEYLPYGAFPPFFYWFAGAAFKVLKGRGFNQYLTRATYPYTLGVVLAAPILAFQKHLNLAMQTVVCRRS